MCDEGGIRRGARGAVVLGLAAFALGAAACGGGAPAPVPSNDPRGAYEALAPCSKQPPAPPVEDIPGLSLPREATVYSVHETGPLTRVDGFVALTPLEVREHYESRDDIEVLQIEDEGFETEAVVSDGTHRMYVKANVICRRGSNLTATVAPESAATALPTPSAAATPPPP